MWSKGRTLKLEDPQDLVLISTCSPCVCKCVLKFLKVIVSQERMTPKVDQIHFFFLSPGTENKTKHRKMHERDRAITSLFRKKMRPSSARVQRCTFSLTASQLRHIVLPERGVPEAAQKGQRVRQEISYICRRGRRAVTTSSSSCFPKPDGCQIQSNLSFCLWEHKHLRGVNEKQQELDMCTKELSFCLYTATIVWILLEARAWEFVEFLCGSALLSYTTET